MTETRLINNNNIDTINNAAPIPRYWAMIPNVRAITEVSTVLSNDWADITDVSISLGVLSATKPVSAGLRIFSAM